MGRKKKVNLQQFIYEAKNFIKSQRDGREEVGRSEEEYKDEFVGYVKNILTRVGIDVKKN